eukprot:Opistho-2@35685
MADPSFVIRRGVSSDAPNLVPAVMALAKETEDIDLDLPTVTLGVNAVFNSPDGARGFYLVAETDDAERNFMGCLMVTSEWSDWRNGQYWWIQSVYVNQQYRKRGVFKALFEAVNTAARDAGDVRYVRLYVERTNERAKRAYESLGMSHSHYDMYEMSYLDK